MPIDRTAVIGDDGSGRRWRIARSLAVHCRKLVMATSAPRAMRGMPRILRPLATWNWGSSWVAATPVAIRARAVRFQARNVRSLA